MHVAVAGATGQVGGVMLSLLAQRGFPVDKLRLMASSRSAGRQIDWNGQNIQVEDIATADFSDIELVLMSAGKSVSLQLSPKIAEAGAVVIDNSSAWRMDPEVPLVVADVNNHALDAIRSGAGSGAKSNNRSNNRSNNSQPRSSKSNIIANPNCTTMVAMMALKPLHDFAGLQSMVISTYQATSGAGLAGVQECHNQLAEGINDAADLTFDGNAVSASAEVFPAPVAYNVVPLCGSIQDDGSLETDEEQKLRNESRKILEIPDLKVSATCVRVPVFTGHSMAVTASFAEPISPEEAASQIEQAPGVELSDMPAPLNVAGTDQTLVGRIRRDETQPHSLSFFLTGDNLRKGAALNAIQIAELL